MARRTIWRRLGIVLAAGVLFAGVAAVIGQHEAPAGANIEAFNVLLPAADEIAGWSASQRPVADTEEMKRAVGELLNYNAGSFVVYSKGDLQISIFAAYWKPGRMSPRLVATHTPDVCWVGNGWVCRAAGLAELHVAEGRRLQVKHRVFDSPAGAPQHVVFCHLVGGVSRDYGRIGTPPWYAFLSDLRWGGFQLREEQLFFRVSSNQPMDSFADTTPVRLFLGRLAPFLRPEKPDA